MRLDLYADDPFIPRYLRSDRELEPLFLWTSMTGNGLDSPVGVEFMDYILLALHHSASTVAFVEGSATATVEVDSRIGNNNHSSSN